MPIRSEGLAGPNSPVFKDDTIYVTTLRRKRSNCTAHEELRNNDKINDASQKLDDFVVGETEK